MFEKFAPVFSQNLSLEDKIRFFFREHITFLQKNPRLPGFILNEINRNPQRMKKLLDKVDIHQIWWMLEEQHHDELAEYNITIDEIPQIMTTIASISVFPFAARGILEEILKKGGIDFDEYLEERKEFAADFVISALQNSKKPGSRKTEDRRRKP